MKIKYIIIFLPFSYACIPSVFISSISHQSIEKNSKIYISKLDGISMEENIFREKLNIALKRKGYITVNNFQKSDFYLFINFNNHLQKNVEQKSSTDIFLMELFLVESKNISNNSGLPFDRNDALWICKIELTRLDFLKHQDEVMDNISKYFCNSYYGRKMLL
tara:strand:- start:614 stop:1102 length:489 start_codon:yes stop_codon:yes gene_type:complete